MAVFSQGLLWWLWNSSSVYVFFFPLFLFCFIFMCRSLSFLPPSLSVPLSSSSSRSLFLVKEIDVHPKSWLIMWKWRLYLGVTVSLSLLHLFIHRHSSHRSQYAVGVSKETEKRMVLTFGLEIFFGNWVKFLIFFQYFVIQIISLTFSNEYNFNNLM